MAEPRPCAALEPDGIVVLLRDRQDSGDEDHERNSDPLPHVDECDREQREVRIDEPRGRVDPDERESSC